VKEMRRWGIKSACAQYFGLVVWLIDLGGDCEKQMNKKTRHEVICSLLQVVV
jgi:hypothetical protein